MNNIVHCVVEVTEDRTTVLKAYTSVHKAIEFAEDLAKSFGLIRDEFMNYEHVWATDEMYPVVYIETLDVE